jgi:hypothetical protein
MKLSLLLTLQVAAFSTCLGRNERGRNNNRDRDRNRRNGRGGGGTFAQT